MRSEARGDLNLHFLLKHRLGVVWCSARISASLLLLLLTSIYCSIHSITMYLAEELLENILSYSLSSHPSTALPLLSASKRTNRIAIPLLLAHLRLRTHEHASQLAAVFERLPSYASKVRTVRIDSIDFADAFSTIATHLARSGVKLERLDIPVDKERFYEHLPVLGPCAVMMERERIAHDNWQKTVDTFCNALRRLPDTHELVVRDGGVKQNVLPGQWVRKAQLQEALANAIAHWPSLVRNPLPS